MAATHPAVYPERLWAQLAAGDPTPIMLRDEAERQRRAN